MNPYHLSKGTNKYFIGQLLTFISSILSFLVIVITIFITSGSNVDVVAMSVTMAMIGIAVILLSLIGLIFMILGAKQLMDENSNFKKAFYGMILMIFASAFASFFSDQQVNLILSEIPQIINVANSIFILKGMSEMFHELKEIEEEKKIKKVLPIIISIFGGVCALDLLVHSITSTQMILGMTIFLIIIDFIGYFILMRVLWKARIIFKELVK